MWMDYLRWYRAVLDLPVENGIEVTRIEPAETVCCALALRGAAKPEVIARKVVLATGREGLGEPVHPRFRAGPAARALGTFVRSRSTFPRCAGAEWW